MDEPGIYAVPTATGIALAKRLNGMVGQLLAGTLHTTTAAVVNKTLVFIAQKQRRQAALQAAVSILDAGQGLSRWALALALETALRRFEAVGHRRVLNGARPATELEACLLVLLESGPRCASKLWPEIRDLPGRR